jgi:hypothetical protein
MRRQAAALLAVALVLLPVVGCDGQRLRPAAERWQPRPGTAWQWQPSGRINQSVDVPVYDIDGFENDSSTVAELHAKGRRVICYLDAGAWEDFRPDRNAFPAGLRGRNNGWSGER